MPGQLITLDTVIGRRRLLPLDSRSPFDPRDFRFVPTVERLDPNAHYDLCALGLMPPIRDQGEEGSCAGHSSSEYLGHLFRKLGLPLIFSPAFMYYLGRLIEGWQNQDSGAYLRDEFSVLKKNGCCLEQFMPYIAGQFATPPPAAALADALTHLIDSYAAVAMTDLDAALAQNTAVAVGSYWYNEWFNGGDPQYHILPDSTTQAVGAHAWLICGAQTSLNVNTGKVERLYRHHGSWGLGFGDGTGHVWMPAHIVQTQVYEFWTAMKAALGNQALALTFTTSTGSLASGDYTPITLPPPTPPTPPPPTPSLLADLEAEFTVFAQLLAKAGSNLSILVES